MEVQLSKRLQAIADCVPAGSRVVDVGTDHGYIPIYLIQNHIVKSCIATDINKGPVANAKRQIARFGLKDIDVRLGRGLEPIREGETDVLMISGMGGYLICDILKAALPLVKKSSQLILQPQQDVPVVRRFLHTIGFCISNECFVEDEGKYYTILVAQPGKECYTKEYEYTYGKCLIEKRDPIFKEWLLLKQKRLEAIEAQLEGVETPTSLKRKEALKKEKLMHKEVMACIF
ncbi:hypothetical protein CS063_06950 [Sporanaerobium hydrogeniformans]|uniref:Uncharacterized protein n=1 Tax=Sporanaerobium hydrogeniformans TaxID=3072179 RepID=A0AC61DDY6_9FIRM|nr:class I SAM-dependent methyltransferase [Sporanaerobium hydrogeniformans]PHV71065.1 hypothetical protein CS063_06950 [Sporanaerobium hydrogeniformans]